MSCLFGTAIHAFCLLPCFAIGVSVTFAVPFAITQQIIDHYQTNGELSWYEDFQIPLMALGACALSIVVCPLLHTLGIVRSLCGAVIHPSWYLREETVVKKEMKEPIKTQVDQIVSNFK